MRSRILGNEYAPAAWHGAFSRYVELRILKNRSFQWLNRTASNIRLLAYYEAQQGLANSVYLHEKPQKERLSFHSLKAWWQYSSCVDKTYLGIKLGLAAQVGHFEVIISTPTRTYH